MPIHQAQERHLRNQPGACPVAETYCRVQIVARGIPSGCSNSPEGQGINDQSIEIKGQESVESLSSTIVSIIPYCLHSVGSWEDWFQLCQSPDPTGYAGGFRHSGRRDLGRRFAFYPTLAMSHPPCLQTIALGCRSLQHIEKLPIPALVPAISIAVDSHARSMSRRRCVADFCFWLQTKLFSRRNVAQNFPPPGRTPNCRSA